MHKCQDCGVAVSRKQSLRCRACAAKARWANPAFKEKARSGMIESWNRADRRERTATSIGEAMHRPEVNALLRRPKSKAARANMKAAQNRPELIEAKRKRMKGNVYGTRRRGPQHPNYGKHLPGETRRKISLAKQGTQSGAGNPFYGKKHLLEARASNSMKHIGKNMGSDNPSWRGGVFTDPYEHTFSRFIKNQVRERDNFVCRLCGKPEGKRHHHVHHIFYNMKDRDLSRLITLCVPCHKLVHRQKKIWPAILTAKLV